LDAVRQVLFVVLGYYAYRLTRGAVDDSASAMVAFEHARMIISVERDLGIFIEPGVQAFVERVPGLEDVAVWLYVNVQSSVTLAALLFLFHNRRFYFVRNMFMVAWALAIVGYTLYPTAPPRLMPEWGFHDSIAESIGIDDATVDALFNPYAAVPSMHVGFALIVGVPLALAVKRRVTRLAWGLYPLVVTLVTVATANHFWTDAVLGAVTVAAAAAAAGWLARLRPAAWSFSAAESVS
jgi:PAP2 superfamily